MNTMDTETLHLALAACYPGNTEDNVRHLARRYMKREKSPKIKRIYKSLILDPRPSVTVLEVCYERFGV